MDKLVKLGQDMALLWSKYRPMYLNGVRNTLILALAATVIGCIIGLICGILNTIPYSKNDPLPKRFLLKLIRVIVRIYVEVFRGTPMVLQAVFIYYGLPYFSGGSVAFQGNSGIWLAALIVVSINTGAYMAESVRGGIISIDPGQTEGAMAIGMTHVNVKDTSVMFIISFTEFFAAHRYIVGVNNMYFPSAAIEMIGYLTMTLIASFLLRWVERRMDGADSYELAQDDQLTMTAGTYNHPDKGTPFDERSKEYRDNLTQSMKNRNFTARGDR